MVLKMQLYYCMKYALQNILTKAKFNNVYGDTNI